MDLVKWFIDPIVVVLLLVGCAAIRLFPLWRQKPYRLLIPLFLFYCCSTPFISNNLLYSLEKPTDHSSLMLSDLDLPEKPLDILLLAGGISSDHSQGKRFELTTSGDRVLLAVQLALLNENSRLWIAEDQQKKQTSSILVELGVFKPRIHSLPGAKNTWSEINTFAEYYTQTSTQHIPVIVTSAYHVKRVKIITRNLGMTINHVAANHIGKKSNLSLHSMIPDVVALSGTTKAIEEWLASAFYLARIRFS